MDEAMKQLTALTLWGGHRNEKMTWVTWDPTQTRQKRITGVDTTPADRRPFKHEGKRHATGGRHQPGANSVVEAARENIEVGRHRGP
ncbi:hypothetical protein GCM10017687_03860 [Streptomyces echinatus]